jgi:subtilisin family serine protease
LTAALAAAALGTAAAVISTGGLQPGRGLIPLAGPGPRPTLTPTPILPSTPVLPSEPSSTPPAAGPPAATTEQELARLLPGVPVDRGTDPITGAARRAGQPAPLRLAANASAVPADRAGRGQYIVMLASPAVVPSPSPSSSPSPSPSVPPSAAASPGAVPPEASAAADRARRGGAEVGARFSGGYVARFTPAQLAAARTDPATGFVEIDQVVTASTRQNNPPWGVDRIDQRYRPLSRSYDYGLTGAGVKAYVIDTGLRGTHAELRGRVAAGADFVKDGRGTNDCHGHGTHVAGTIGGFTYGVAKAVTIVPVRVLGCLGYGSTAGVISGIDWVTTHHSGPSVANMSLGDWASSALDAAVRRSIASGVTYVVAAGNELVNPCSGADAESPPRVLEAITVGATQELDSRDVRYSNFGPCLDVFAPGTNITSAWHSSDTARQVLSGTSMASPHVAGTVAQYLQAHPAASPATVQVALVQRATAGVVQSRGARSPDKFLFSPIALPSVTVTSSLAGLGARAVLPRTGAFTTQVPGDVTGILTGPAGTDFDLFLSRWTGSEFAVVARSEQDGSSETVRYTGAPATYYWSVVSNDGSGSFTLTTSEP